MAQFVAFYATFSPQIAAVPVVPAADGQPHGRDFEHHLVLLDGNGCLEVVLVESIAPPTVD